jgi:hypothetical protein
MQAVEAFCPVPVLSNNKSDASYLITNQMLPLKMILLHTGPHKKGYHIFHFPSKEALKRAISSQFPRFRFSSCKKNIWEPRKEPSFLTIPLFLLRTLLCP